MFVDVYVLPVSSAEVFGFRQAIDISSGFLVIGKNNGSVTLIDARNDTNVISTDITMGSNDGACMYAYFFLSNSILGCFLATADIRVHMVRKKSVCPSYCDVVLSNDN